MSCCPKRTAMEAMLIWAAEAEKEVAWRAVGETVELFRV